MFGIVRYALSVYGVHPEMFGRFLVQAKSKRDIIELLKNSNALPHRSFMNKIDYNGFLLTKLLSR